MHIRRLASFLLGAWLLGSLFMILVATHNLSAVDRLLSAPSRPASNLIEILGNTAARTLLRFQASELNRWYFDTWEWTQIGLGVLLVGALLAGSSRRSTVVLGVSMLLAVVVLHFVLSPQVTRLGRALDFLAANKASPDRAKFWNYHMAYVVIEGIKDVLGLMLLSSLLRRHDHTPVEGERKSKWVRAR
jgi:hypothetical protein